MAIQALVMGFGGTGAHILTYLKEIAVLKHGKKPDSLKFLLFDTIAGWAPGKTVQIIGGVGEEKLAAGHEEGTSLDNVSEYFYLQDQHPSLPDYVYQLLAEGATSVNDYPHLKDWLHTPWLGQRIPKDRLNVKDGAAQQRQIGRFAMFQNVPAIVSHLERALHELQSQAHGATVSVWLIGSAAGGTGAGSLLDAALMTRLVAARLNVGIQISSVIVLPSIYSEKPGISDARAYSLFRELDRFQEVGFGTHKNRYLVNNRQVSSEVSYDATGQHRALVEAKLFDNLFYLGTSCRNDSDREAFFSSVANALDPYLDEGQGRELLQNSINEIGFAASSFGAARLYVPQETYAELFAWEEVREFLKAMTAPKEEGKQVTDVYAGEKADRQAGATTKVKNLLPLFEKLLELKGKTSEQISGFAKNTLDPQTMVTQWYQLGAVGIIDVQLSPAERQKAVLAYTNPYFSLREVHRERVAVQDIEVKTYKEYQKVGRSKEDQKASRDRFAQELAQRTERYKQTGQGTFEEGRQFILKVLSNHLAGKIDTLIQDEFARFPQVAWDHASPAAGTVITRLYQELREAITPGGPLETISTIITTFLNALDAEENLRSHQVVNEVNTLRNRNPSFLDTLGTWVEEPQINAREQCVKYIQWYQKRGLLKDLQILVQQVQQRFVEWAEAFRRVLEDLALSVPNRFSALEETNVQHLSRLQGRLYRLARNRSALISCEPDLPGGGRDETMQGYREELRRYAVGEGEKRLAYQLLTQARWQLKRDRGTTQVELVVKLGDMERTFSSGQSLRRLHQDLHNYFRQFVDNELGKRDIFDYLLYAQNQRNVSPAQIARLLDGACAVLLTTSGTMPTVSWVYNNPKEPTKTNFITSLGVELTKIHPKTDQSEKNIYSDRQSLTLLKIAKPAPSEVINIGECRKEYVKERGQDVSNDFKSNETLYRAQVYHPFRAELEAWYIERRQGRWLSQESNQDDQISPRLTRLLEHPDMMQAFVYCIATKVVEKDSQRQIWVFHNAVLNKDLELTTTEESTADVVRAAVMFVLRQQEGKPRSTVKITYDHAMQSAASAAQREGKNRDDLVEAFVGKPNSAERTPLDEFLDNNEYFRQFKDDGSPLELAEREKRNVKMIFQFYGDRKRRTQLGDRMELP
jgi:hypothetical protein